MNGLRGVKPLERCASESSAPPKDAARRRDVANALALRVRKPGVEELLDGVADRQDSSIGAMLPHYADAHGGLAHGMARDR